MKYRVNSSGKFSIEVTKPGLFLTREQLYGKVPALVAGAAWMSVLPARLKTNR